MKRIFLLTTFYIMILIIMTGCEKKVETISLNNDIIEVEHGQTFCLTATIYPEDAENQSISWEFDTDALSQLSGDSKTTQEFFTKNIGTTSVKVYSTNGKYDSCDIIVRENDEDIAKREKAEEETRIAAEKKAEEERIKREKAERLAQKNKADQLAIPCAKQLLTSRLKDPYPVFDSVEIINSDDYMRYIVKIVCNSRNSYGGYTGNMPYMVAIRIVDLDEGTFEWKANCIMSSDNVALYLLYTDEGFENFFFKDDWNKQPN